MANQVNVNTTNNQVTVTQGTTQIVTVSAQGPQGVQGPVGATGPSGSIPNTGSFATTGSNSFIGNQIITGSLIISGSSTFTNIGPASFSGSTSITGSLNVTGSIIISGSGQVITSLDTGSFITNSQTGSFITNSDTGSFVTNSQTGSFATTGSNSFTGSLDVSGSLTITGSLTVSGSGTFTNIGPFNQTGESLFIGNITASGDISASSATITALTGSFNHIITDDETIEFRNKNTGAPIGRLKFDASTGLNVQDNAGARTKIRAGRGEFLSLEAGVVGFNSLGSITASVNISASGDIVGSNLSGTNTGDQDLSNLVTNSSTASFAITGSNVLFGNVTSSGNISASGDIVSNGLTTTNNIFGKNIFFSQDISGSINSSYFGDEYNAHGGDANSGFTLLSLGDKPSISAIGTSIEIGNATNSTQTGISLVGEVTASSNISASGDIVANKVTADVVDTSFETFLNFEAATAFTFIAPFPLTINFTGSSTSSMDVAGFVTASANTSTFSTQQRPPITLNIFDKLKITPSASGLFSFSGSRTI